MCNKLLSIILVLLLFPATTLLTLTVEEIIDKMDENQLHESSEYTAIMEIHDRFGMRVKTFKGYTKDDDKILLEFTNPEEAGQKILRLQDDVYLYFPQMENVVRLQGNSLKDSVMGSDFSYEDLTNEKSTLDDYHAELLGTEEVGGYETYVIELTGKTQKEVYPYQKIWVDTELFVSRKIELYSLSRKLLREMYLSDIREVSGKNIPFVMEMSDKLKQNSKTVFIIQTIEIDIPISDDTFSLGALEW
jgi:outer membrane lipoprotein-sorting protein